MISAPSTASGRSVNSGVSAITVTSASTGGDQRRHLALGAGAVVDRALREAAAARQPAEQARADVGGAEGDHLLAGIEPVVVLVGERLARRRAPR